MRVEPERRTGRVASSRAATGIGEGMADVNPATAVRSLGIAKPAGSMRQTSKAYLAVVVLPRENSAGMGLPLHSSAGARGPQPARSLPRSQYTSPGLKISLFPGTQNQPT